MKTLGVLFSLFIIVAAADAAYSPKVDQGVPGPNANPWPVSVQNTPTVTDASIGVNGSAVKTSSSLAGISDGTNQQPLIAPIALGDGVNGNNSLAEVEYLWNGASFDRSRGDTTNGKWVNVKTSVLPTGASTSALQTTGNTSLSSIDGKITTTANGVKVDVIASALPSGAATSALQTTANTSLASIDTKTPALSGGKVPVDASGSVAPKTYPNSTGSGSAAAATVSTVVTLTAPANAVGFVLQNLDTSTANVRWSIGRTATATLGQQLQPGRDTGFIPCGANVSLVAESGTQNYDIQWVSQ